jgi:hypothetical protein
VAAFVATTHLLTLPILRADLKIHDTYGLWLGLPIVMAVGYWHGSIVMAVGLLAWVDSDSGGLLRWVGMVLNRYA